jgi:hypothetical protein
VNSRLFVVVGLVWVLSAIACGREPATRLVLALPPDDKELTYTLVDSLSDVPAPVLQTLHELCGGCRIADIGESFRSTDVVVIESLPTRRLVRAGYSGTTWFIHYEHGGLGYHEHLATFESHDQVAKLLGGRTVNTENGVVTVVYSDCSPGQKECEW